MEKKTQKERVVEYIQRNGSISSLECAMYLKITDLQGIVRDLKKQGYNIQDKWMNPEDKESNRYKIYWIEYNYGAE